MTKYIYKIKNEDGLYSNGGKYPSFTKDGKAWSSLARLKAHLRLFYHAYHKKWNMEHYNGCVITAIPLNYETVISSVEEFINLEMIK